MHGHILLVGIINGEMVMIMGLLKVIMSIVSISLLTLSHLYLYPFRYLSPSSQLFKERELRSQLEALSSELAPLEQQRHQLAQRSERRTNTGWYQYCPSPIPVTSYTVYCH